MNRFIRRVAGSLLLFAGIAGAAPQLVIPVAASAPKSDATAVRFNTGELLDLQPGAEVELTLPNGKRHAYIYEQTISHGGGFSTWIARSSLTGDNQRAIVTTGPGGSFGWMRTSDGEYRIYNGEGHDWLAASPPMNFRPTFAGGDAIPVPDDPVTGPSVLKKGVPTYIAPHVQLKTLGVPKAAPTPGVQVDVMVLYTLDLANKLGAGVLPMIYNLIASTNQAYVDSEIAITLRLVNATMIDYPNTNGSSATLSGMRGAVGNLNSSFFESLTWGSNSLRNAVGADMVALLRDGPTDTGGIASLLFNPTVGTINQTNAYSVNNYCAQGCQGIFAHELGHNMGNAHDRATVARDRGDGTVPANSGVFSHSFGHYDCANGLTCNPFAANGCPSDYAQCQTPDNANDFGTIMSYVSPRVMKFSNPAIFCVPTGGAAPGRSCGAAGQADNALSMNNVRQNVSAYRNESISALPGSVQFTVNAYTGTETGGTITFTVSRASGSAGAVAVNYVASGVTATAGVDFTLVSGQLNWANGDSDNKTFTVALTNDLAVEGIETLSATLTSPAGATGVYLGYPASATGLILEAWPVGGSAPSGFASIAAPDIGGWAVANDSSNDADGISFKSGAFANNATGNSTTQFTGTFAAGLVSFAYRVSSYPNNGFFEFLIDGTVAYSDSGDLGWKLASVPITAGTHTLQFRFRKTLSFPCRNAIPSGEAVPPYPNCADRAWIDQVSLPLTLAASTTSLATSVNPSNAGQSVTFTATVSGGSGAVAGTVSFRDGTSNISSCTAVAIASGSAACTTAALTSGTHSITAVYSGSTAYATSTSSALTQTVTNPTNVALTVTKTGAGSGTVTSSPAGLNCGATCTANFTSGTTVTLTASPALGSIFIGWSGGCTGTLTCQLAPTAATTVTANFVGAAGTPTGAANPVSADFGGQSIQTTSGSLTVTLTNVGTGALAITSVSVSTSNYSQTHNCGSLTTGASCTATLTFTPSAQGALAGTLTFVTSAGNVTVTLAGTGERSLITHYYRSILRRAPDSGGKAFWESEAARMAGLQANVNETWYSMATFFYFSSEYASFGRDNTGFVTDLYNTFFNRPPDGGGLAFWTGQITAGMPREVVLVSFMLSPEFVTFTQGIFGNAASRAEVDTVMDFYRGVLSRLPDTGGFNNWVQEFRTAQCQGAGAVYARVESMSNSFANGGEYAGRARNNAQYVGDLYNAFLRRGGDLAGVQFWINQLNSTGMSRNAVRQSFISSPEFTNRVNAIIAQGCQS